MTNEEARTAFLHESPVTFLMQSASYQDKIRYQRITAIIYREEKSKVTVTLELLDKNGNSVIIARPDRVMLAEEVQQ